MCIGKQKFENIERGYQKNDRQHNDQRKKDKRTNNDLQTITE